MEKDEYKMFTCWYNNMKNSTYMLMDYSEKNSIDCSCFRLCRDGVISFPVVNDFLCVKVILSAALGSKGEQPLCKNRKLEKAVNSSKWRNIYSGGNAEARGGNSYIQVRQRN